MIKLCGVGVPPWRATSVVALGALVFFAVGAGAATDTHVRCGDTITQDTKLDSDLIDCPGDGLAIGADDITLDLGGHTIDGRGGGVGVDNSAHDGVTVQRGTIREFGRGVQLYGTARNAVQRLEIEAAVGVALEDLVLAQENVIAHNTIRALYFGVLVEAGPNNQVERNAVSGAYYGIGLLYVGQGTRAERNRLSDNRVGIYVSDSFGAPVVSDNVAEGNCTGIELFATHEVRVEGNTVLRSGENCRALVTGAGGAGDGITSEHVDNVIEDNLVRENLDDGIDVEGWGDVVAGNRADRNADLGIEAEPGVIDGGGNRARGNGNPLQCLNVPCS